MIQELLPILLFSTFLGGIVQGVSGFAFAIIFLAIMQYFLPYTELLALSTMLALIMLMAMLVLYRKYIVWRWLPLPLVINFVFTLGAIRLLNASMDFPYWHNLLGIVFIVLSVYLYFWQQKIKIEPNIRNAFLFSATGGILGGLFGVGGPPVVLYFLAVTNTKEEYLGTIQMFFFINMLYDLFGRVANGMVTTAAMQYAALSVIPIWLGVWIGHKIFQRLDSEMLKKLIYLMMFLDGWYMLLR